MTTDEVIGKLSNIKFYLTAGNPIWDSDMIREVMDMAIEALKQNKCDGCFYLDRNGATCEFCARNYPDQYSTKKEGAKE